MAVSYTHLNASFVGKYFSPGSFQRFPDSRGIGFTDPLIALTMIVGADIEMGMVFPVVPANVFFLIHPVRAVCAPYCFGFIDLDVYKRQEL